MQTTLTAAGGSGSGMSPSDLVAALQQTDTTASLVAAVREIARPPPTAATGIDPELREWMALRPNLPEDQQTVIDGLAADAIRKLQAWLRLAAAGGVAAFSGQSVFDA